VATASVVLPNASRSMRVQTTSSARLPTPEQSSSAPRIATGTPAGAAGSGVARCFAFTACAC
jgi:hypothetical protein